MQTLRIGELEPDPCFINEKSEYESMHKLIETRVLDACNNKPKPIAAFLKESVKRILH